MCQFTKITITIRMPDGSPKDKSPTDRSPMDKNPKDKTPKRQKPQRQKPQKTKAPKTKHQNICLTCSNQKLFQKWLGKLNQ